MRISNIGTIELLGMQFFAFHGVLEQERENGNLFIVDFRCHYPIAEAAETDDLSKTLDYGKVHELVAEQMAIPSKLLENVAGRIADSIATRYPELEWFEVSVAKQAPPVNGKAEWSKITVTGGSKA